MPVVFPVGQVVSDQIWPAHGQEPRSVLVLRRGPRVSGPHHLALARVVAGLRRLECAGLGAPRKLQLEGGLDVVAQAQELAVLLVAQLGHGLRELRLPAAGSFGVTGQRQSKRLDLEAAP